MIAETKAGKPKIGPECYVFPTAVVAGGATLAGRNLIVGKVRADDGSPIFLGNETNVQDGATVHGLRGKYIDVDGQQYSVHIGRKCSIAHGSLVHGPARVHSHVFVGFGASVVSSEIGQSSFISSGAYIDSSQIGRECHIGKFARIIGVKIPDGSHVPDFAIITDSQSAGCLSKVSNDQASSNFAFNEEVVQVNACLCLEYRELAPGH